MVRRFEFARLLPVLKHREGPVLGRATELGAVPAQDLRDAPRHRQVALVHVLVVGVVDIELPRPRTADVESNRSFVDYANDLRKLLMQEGGDG